MYGTNYLKKECVRTYCEEWERIYRDVFSEVWARLSMEKMSKQTK